MNKTIIQFSTFLLLIHSLNASEELYKSLIDLDVISKYQKEGWKVQESTLYYKLNTKSPSKFVYKELEWPFGERPKSNYAKDHLQKYFAKHGIVKYVSLSLIKAKPLEVFEFQLYIFKSKAGCTGMMKEMCEGKNKKKFKKSSSNNSTTTYDSVHVKKHWIFHEEFAVQAGGLSTNHLERVMTYEIIKKLKKIKKAKKK